MAASSGSHPPAPSGAQTAVDTRYEKWLDQRYKPIVKFGRGAQGTVVMAQHRKTRNLVAVKKGPLDQGHRSLMTYREAKFLEVLRMKNIINLKDFYKTDTEYVLIMTACDLDLTYAINYYRKETVDPDKPTRLPQLFVWRILSRLADAVAFMHHNGVVHHDIKAPNVLLRWEGRDPKTSYPDIILADFGAATSVSEDNYSDLGAPAYTSIYHPPDPNRGYTMDIWALGCIIHVIAHGRTPTLPVPEKMSHDKLLSDAWVKDPKNKSLKSIEEVYSKELHHFMHSCLRFDPNNRIKAEPLATQVREEWRRQLAHKPFERLLKHFEKRQLANYVKQAEAREVTHGPSDWPPKTLT